MTKRGSSPRHEAPVEFWMTLTGKAGCGGFKKFMLIGRKLMGAAVLCKFVG